MASGKRFPHDPVLWPPSGSKTYLTSDGRMGAERRLEAICSAIFLAVSVICQPGLWASWPPIPIHDRRGAITMLVESRTSCPLPYHGTIDSARSLPNTLGASSATETDATAPALEP